MPVDKKGNKITHIGGQAVIEGVMMRGKHMYAMAVRNISDEIVVDKRFFTPIGEKYKILGLPIIRGFVSFIDSLVIGTKILYKSADMAGLEDVEEEPSRFEKFLIDRLGDKLDKILIAVSMVFAIVLALVIFVFFPTWIASFFNPYVGDNKWVISLIEGVIKVIVFVGYLWVISKTKGMKRVFQYHGAEHKTINCFEHYNELTVENVKAQTRLHKRCGTSFLFLVIIVSIIIFMLVTTEILWLRVLLKLICLPLVAGISYEIIRWAGTHDNTLVDIVSYPGLCLQKITTAEPDDKQIEVAIKSMQEVLDSEPEYA